MPNQIDGPYDPQNGLVFDPDAVLLDPYARSVAGGGSGEIKRPAATTPGW